jgi:hypothetical protein
MTETPLPNTGGVFANQVLARVVGFALAQERLAITHAVLLH